MKFQHTQFIPHSRKLTSVELSLVGGVLITLVLGAWTSWTSGNQEALAEGLIRLHIVANSNSQADQELKLDVRDQVLEVAEQLYIPGQSHQETLDLFTQALPELKAAGQAVAGDFPVEIQLSPQWFPSKSYDNFALPAGEYTALQLQIGEAQGENWWCVAYPPLCLGAASQSVDQAVEAGNFSPEEQALITGEGYVFKFKSMELLAQLKEALS